MTSHSFLTIQAPTEGVYKEKGSRFMAFAFPVNSEAEIKGHLQTLRKKHFDARHQGYAYVLGADQERFRAFDDGEPNHSTGDPILGQIRSRKLTNVLVVVVRYFGGTKLGVSGLIQAYRAAASEALSRAVIVEKEVMVNLHLSFSFDATPVIMKLIKDFELRLLSQEFGDDTRMVLGVPLKSKELIGARLELLRATGSRLSWDFVLGNS
ncbi:MAG: YigZ family protein [Cyclobacteriaceae bacterium]|nr:YigZ family protein [Cyclobacteriaceae bacterium]